MFDFRLYFLICLALGINACRETEELGSPLRLTPYIQSGNIEEAQQLSLVTGLTPNITSYTGFLTVDEECDSNMFFWFFPAKNNYESNPITLWLSGGPGVPSVHELLIAHGPYELTMDLELKLREYSWNNESSMLYIDNPVGTGFSFAKGVECYSRNQSHITQNLVNALEQFFELFPELKEKKFFLAGESYAGHYIPSLGNAIHQGPTSIKNLEGFAIGNGLIDPINQANYSNLYYQLGLIDMKTKNEMAEIEKNMQVAIQNGNYLEAYDLRDQATRGVLRNSAGFTQTMNFLYSKSPKQADYGAFLDSPEIREAIHVGNATWHYDSSDVSDLLKGEKMKSVVSDLVPIMNNYRSLLYYGQMDLLDPYTASVNFIQQLNWDGASEYQQAPRYTWGVDGELAGYGKTASKFTELLVRNAGHQAPMDQPKWVYNMFNTFIKAESFNTFKVKPKRPHKKKFHKKSQCKKSPNHDEKSI